MPSKSVLPRGFKAEAERIAESYRQSINLSKFDPLDAFVLAEHLDIDVFSVDDIFSNMPDHPHYSTMSDTTKFSAMWSLNTHGSKIIIHNTNHSGHRQQSNLMHELSHIIRKHEIPEEQAKLCAKFGMHYYNPLHEQEAKYLGGCLQITRPGLLWALKRNYSVEQISRYFNASVEMVKYRLGVTGALIQKRKTSNF